MIDDCTELIDDWTVEVRELRAAFAESADALAAVAALPAATAAFLAALAELVAFSAAWRMLWKLNIGGEAWTVTVIVWATSGLRAL